MDEWMNGNIQSDICFHLFILSQVERYALNIVENGTSVNEEVEVDVDEQTEVIRVPKHNNVDALELMNDFNAVIYKPIGHFRITFSLFLKASLGAHLFI